MTGTYTGQFVMNGFLDIRLPIWVRVAVTRLIAILPTLLVAVLYRNSNGTELDVLNEWLNVLNSVQLPFALVPVSTGVRLPTLCLCPTLLPAQYSPKGTAGA